MKKRLLPVLISLFLVFSLCGCSSGGITGVWLFEDPAYESLYGIDPVQMYMQLNKDGTIIMISVSKSDYYDTTSYEYIKGTYVEKEDTRDAVDIAELNAEIRQVTARVNDLRTQIDAIIAEIERDEDE